MATYPGKDIEREASCASCAACGQTTLAPAEAAAAAWEGPAARIVAVEPESPADDAGFTPGCYLTTVDGEPLRDIIDWRWLAADDVICVGYIDLDGEAGEVELEREPGERWGFEFDGVLFDSVKLCRNACVFCFMRQLPDGVRPSLVLRDDDFRLSFLSGTFVTLTNLKPEDEARIIEQHISPLRVSLHASEPELRRRMIGKHAAHGLAALDRLLAAGIEARADCAHARRERWRGPARDLGMGLGAPRHKRRGHRASGLHQAPDGPPRELHHPRGRPRRHRCDCPLPTARPGRARRTLGLRRRRVLRERLRCRHTGPYPAGLRLRRLRHVRGRHRHRPLLRGRVRRGLRKRPGCPRRRGGSPPEISRPATSSARPCSPSSTP